MQLSQALQALTQAALAGSAPLTQLEERAMQALQAQGGAPDYLTVRQRHDLQPPQSGTATGTLVTLGAARLGGTRLIDNLEF